MSFYFWRNWRYFSKVELIKQNAAIQAPDEENNFKVEYKWLRCNQNSLEKNLEGLLFGIAINQSWELPEIKNSRLSIQSKWIQTLEELKETQKTKIMEELEWSIWLKLIDISTNLQWLKWKHKFWFYCLIKWLEAKSNCPYWNCEITVDTLGTNSNLVSTFNLMVEVEKEKGISCIVHNQKCDLYWKTWVDEVCLECILSDHHKAHDYAPLKIVINETKDQCKELSKADNSTKLLVKDQIKIIDQNNNILNKIVNKCFSEHYKALNKLKNKYISKINNIHSPYINQLTQNIKMLEQNQN